MLALGRVDIFVRRIFNRPTIYNNRYVREGAMKTRSERYSIKEAAGMIMKFVRRK